MSEWRGVRWEYTTRLVFGDGLNELGAAGWELVAVAGALCYFKRPVYDSIEEDWKILAAIASEKRPMGG